MSNLRFIKHEHYGELMNLWHLSRVPLSGEATRYKRLLWTSGEFHKLHPEYTSGGIYKDLDCNIS